MFLGLVFQTITNNCKQFMFLCLVYHTIANNFSRNMSVMLHWQRNKKFVLWGEKMPLGDVSKWLIIESPFFS